MDWLWLALLVGFMVVVHRFGMGCCGGGHGHQGTDETRGRAAKVFLKDQETELQKSART